MFTYQCYVNLPRRTEETKEEIDSLTVVVDHIKEVRAATQKLVAEEAKAVIDMECRLVQVRSKLAHARTQLAESAEAQKKMEWELEAFKTRLTSMKHKPSFSAAKKQAYNVAGQTNGIPRADSIVDALDARQLTLKSIMIQLRDTETKIAEGVLEMLGLHLLHPETGLIRDARLLLNLATAQDERHLRSALTRLSARRDQIESFIPELIRPSISDHKS